MGAGAEGAQSCRPFQMVDWRMMVGSEVHTLIAVVVDVVVVGRCRWDSRATKSQGWIDKANKRTRLGWGRGKEEGRRKDKKRSQRSLTAPPSYSRNNTCHVIDEMGRQEGKGRGKGQW